MEIEWSPLAIEKVVELAKYIAKDSPEAALDWANDIFDSAEKLQDHPKLGRIVPEINEDDYRELLEGNYRVIYWLGSPEKISILTVCHGKQLLPLNEVQ
jgi:plasmid stabilization system protein ParE